MATITITDKTGTFTVAKPDATAQETWFKLTKKYEGRFEVLAPRVMRVAGADRTGTMVVTLAVTE